MQLSLPNNFCTTITSQYGDKGKQWLDHLPTILEQCKEHWNLTVEPTTYELSYNYITPVRREDGNEVVLKIGFPKEKEVITEMESLQLFDDVHSVQLLDTSTELTAMLLEKLIPGTTLKDKHLEDDEEATRIALPLLRDIPVPVPQEHSFPSVRDWAGVLQRVQSLSLTGPITLEIAQRAQQLFEELDQSKQEDKLLHGDLHHDNILYDEKKGWVAIDPKGITGDPTFHGSRFIINCWDRTPSTDFLGRRMEMIADAFECDMKRIAQWAYVDLIISNSWYLEEREDPTFNPVFEKLHTCIAELIV